jgi:hypothetical protein
MGVDRFNDRTLHLKSSRLLGGVKEPENPGVHDKNVVQGLTYGSDFGRARLLPRTHALELDK